MISLLVLKMKTSEADPLMVMPSPVPVKWTSPPHSYTPAVKVMPVTWPAPTLVNEALVGVRPAASVYAVSMLLMAVVSMDGVGDV